MKIHYNSYTLVLPLISMFFLSCEKNPMSYANTTPEHKESPLIISDQTSPGPIVINVSGEWTCAKFIRREYYDREMTQPVSVANDGKSSIDLDITGLYKFWNFGKTEYKVTKTTNDKRTMGVAKYVYVNNANYVIKIFSHMDAANRLVPEISYKTTEIGSNNVQFTTVEPYKDRSIINPNIDCYAYETFQLVKGIQ